MIIDQLETAETNQLESEVATDQPESEVTPRLREDNIYQPASEIIGQLDPAVTALPPSEITVQLEPADTRNQQLSKISDQIKPAATRRQESEITDKHERDTIDMLKPVTIYLVSIKC